MRGLLGVVLLSLIAALVSGCGIRRNAAAVDKTATLAASAAAARLTVRPPARSQAVMAYDAERHNSVLFGGLGQTGVYLNDTWVWDGAGWSEQHPSSSPSVRYAAAMTYDATHRVIVLFGGCCDAAGQELGDTWIWDGRGWSRRQPPVSPPARSDAALAYDARIGSVVLLGGGQGATSRISAAPLLDQWAWDGNLWTRMSPAANSLPRRHASLVLEPRTSRLLLFGGYTATGSPGDSWEWDGSTWTQQHPPQSPPPRYGEALAPDARTELPLLFGGQYGGELLADTWSWDGRTWVEQHPRLAPPARQDATIAYDASRRQVVLFGGAGAGGRLDDTWLWDGTNWSPR